MSTARSNFAYKTVKSGLLALAFAVLLAQTGQGAASTPPLTFFKNYFVSGDYAVAGVGLDKTGTGGLVSGEVSISGVPEGAEALAAFLYWQVVSPTGPDSGSLTAKFNHQLLRTPALASTPDHPASPGGPLAVVGDPLGTAACPLTGGGSSNRVYSYRLDVLRFLDIVDGRHRINGPYTVELPDGGSASQMPRAIGASLVVIYRDPDPTAKLNAIVMYDGNYTKQSSQTMTQTIAGYYDPAPVPGKITHIVGSAQASLSERLSVPGSVLDNPFRSLQGPSWDNLTVATASPGGASFDTSVAPRGLISDCLTWGAIVYRTQVNDTDGDGLLDKWESSTSTLYDPEGNALPRLADMGAHADHKDVFVEIGYMTSTGATYGDVPKPAHTHLPTYEALKMMGDAFRDAPVANPDSRTGVSVHFDVGNNYQDKTDGYIVLTGQGARGGEAVDEMATVCPPDPGDPSTCQFSRYPGTVGWKTGFRFVRDQLISATPPAPDASGNDPCDAPGNDGPGQGCERRFDRSRMDMFRYVLFAHALGIPKENCLVDGYPDFACQDTEPLFHVPVTNTGIADSAGGDAIVSLGGFDDAAGRPVGTDYMQAATLMHELGHTFQLRHGGAAGEANCKPNYLSVMNYLFQLRGLLKDGGPPYLDYSSQALPSLNETSLSDPGGLGYSLEAPFSPPPFRTGWYAPYVAGTTIGSPATRHCDGTPLNTDELGALTEPQMIRVNSGTVDATKNAIDWNKSSALQTAQDINFDGYKGPLNAGFNDWAHIRLDQVGSRRNVGAWYWVQVESTPPEYAAYFGPLSLDLGRNELGRNELGRNELGRNELGRNELGNGDLNGGDLGRNELGRNELGRNELGRNELGRNELGSGDEGLGDSGLGDGTDEPTQELALASGGTGPNELTAFVRGTNGSYSTPAGWVPTGEPQTCSTPGVELGAQDCHRIRLDWKHTNLASEVDYQILRAPEGGAPLPIAVVPATVPHRDDYSYVDTDELPNGRFTYSVSARFVGSTSASDVTIMALNVAPSANGQSVTTWEDSSPIAITLKADDADSKSLSYSIVTGPSHGALTTLIGTPPSGTTYKPNLDYYNVSVGLNNLPDGPESFTFMAHESSTWNNLGQDSSPATVDIPVNPVNDPPSLKLKTNPSPNPNQSVTQPAGAQSVPGFVASFFNFSPGPANESGQAVAEYIVSDNNATLFSVRPAIAPDGSLTYTPAPGAAGVATVSVKVRDNGGTDAAHGGVDTSLPPTATFTITINPPPYTLVNVSNLPPGTGVTFKSNSKGTQVPLEFELKKNGTVVDISTFRPRITITGPAGWTAQTYTPGCTTATVAGCSGFFYEADEKSWEFNWKPVNAPVGTYYVVVWIDSTGQRFPAAPAAGFPVVFK